MILPYDYLAIPAAPNYLASKSNEPSRTKIFGGMQAEPQSLSTNNSVGTANRSNYVVVIGGKWGMIRK